MLDKEWATEVSLEELTTLLSQIQIWQSLDLGSTILHLGVHIHRGPMMLVSTDSGRSAAVFL